jgi:hypothetical protein
MNQQEIEKQVHGAFTSPGPARDAALSEGVVGSSIKREPAGSPPRAPHAQGLGRCSLCASIVMDLWLDTYSAPELVEMRPSFSPERL